MVAASDVMPLRRFDPIWPDFDEVGPGELTSEYDRIADTLVVRFSGLDRPTVGVVFGDYELLRVDPVTEEVVGVELEHFVTAAIYVHPEFLDVLQDIAELTPNEVAKIRRRVGNERGAPDGTGSAGATRRLLDSMKDHVTRPGSANGMMRPVRT